MSHASFGKLVHHLTEARFKDFERDLLHGKAQAEHDAKVQEQRAKQRRVFMQAIGTDLKKLDAAVKMDDESQEAALESFLKNARAKSRTAVRKVRLNPPERLLSAAQCWGRQVTWFCRPLRPRCSRRTNPCWRGLPA